MSGMCAHSNIKAPLNNGGGCEADLGMLHCYVARAQPTGLVKAEIRVNRKRYKYIARLFGRYAIKLKACRKGEPFCAGVENFVKNIFVTLLDSVAFFIVY